MLAGGPLDQASLQPLCPRAFSEEEGIFPWDAP